MIDKEVLTGLDVLGMIVFFAVFSVVVLAGFVAYDRFLKWRRKHEG